MVIEIDFDAQQDRNAKPLVFVLQDALLFDLGLPQLIRSANCEPCEIFPNAELAALAHETSAQPDLLVASLYTADTIDRIRFLRALPGRKEVPVLGITDAAGARLDFGKLKACGVVGLVDRTASLEHLEFCINQIVRDQPERRRWERARTFFPVELDAMGMVSSEFLLNLSLGGVGIVSSRRLEPNTEVRLRFVCADLAPLGEIAGRVARLSETSRALPANRLGIVFSPLDSGKQLILESTVERLLAAGAK